MEKVGEIIARERKALGWSQEVLAARAGMVVSTISKAERGANTPHASNLCAMADAMKISRDVLLAAAGLIDPAKAETTPIYFTHDAAAKLRYIGKIMQRNDSETLLALMDFMATAMQQNPEGSEKIPRIPPPRGRGTHTKGGVTTVVGDGGRTQK